MTLRYCQSFDYLTTALMSREMSVVQHSIGTGRFGNSTHSTIASATLTWSGDGGSAQATVVFGCAYMWTSGAFAVDIVELLGADSTLHVALQRNSLGQLLVTRNGAGSGTTILGPGTTTLTSGVWYYIEIKATIDDTAGAVEVRINGVTELSGSSLDTRNAGAAASVNRWRLGGWSSPQATTNDWDDLYFLDDQGSTNKTFLGDVRVEALFPNGNGNSSVFVGSDADSTNNYLLVDDTTSDDDSTYVEGSSVGDKDTYAMSNVTPSSGTVYAVRPILVARKTDAGSRSVCSVARLSGTEVDSSNETLSTDYQNLWDIRETKPGGGAWTVSDVNGAEFGMKVTV